MKRLLLTALVLMLACPLYAQAPPEEGPPKLPGNFFVATGFEYDSQEETFDQVMFAGLGFGKDIYFLGSAEPDGSNKEYGGEWLYIFRPLGTDRFFTGIGFGASANLQDTSEAWYTPISTSVVIGYGLPAQDGKRFGLVSRVQFKRAISDNLYEKRLTLNVGMYFKFG